MSANVDASSVDRPPGRAADLAFEALADPVRREILGILARHDECSVGELAARITSVGRTAVSSHLRILRSAGLVTERRAGRFRMYSVDASGAARDVLAVVHEMFRSGLADVRAAGPVARDGAGASGSAAAPGGVR